LFFFKGKVSDDPGQLGFQTAVLLVKIKENPEKN